MKVFYNFDSIPANSPGRAIALGMFDGVHLGHQKVIKKALEYGQDLCPGVLTFTTKENRPQRKADQRDILTVDGRLSRLDNLGISEVYIPDFSDIREMKAEDFVTEILCKKLNAKVLCCGEDFRFGKGAKGDASLLKKLSGELEIQTEVIPPVEIEGAPVSSTRIRKYLLDGNLGKANELLGYSYFIAGKVIYGNQLGRTIGCPTVNQKLSGDICIPKFGVYISETELHGKHYPSITNVGVKPTIEGERVPLAETHIIGMNEDLYGEQITVCLHEFIREEMKFASVDALSQQIQKDIQTALRFTGI